MGILNRLLGALSGGTGTRVSDQLLMDKVIGFKGVVPGVGASTILQSVASALSETTSYAICVVDTNFVFPTQASLLGVKDEDMKSDLLDFVGDVSIVTAPTNMKGVRLASLNNRTIVEGMSPRDTKETITDLIEKLKMFFDIILIDLSHEWTNIATYAAIKCNKIYMVADPSLKTMYNMQKSFNLMATLAVPAGKTERVILNKVLPDIVSSASRVFNDAGFTVIGEIPLSPEIAKFGVSGKPAWGGRSTVRELNQFSSVINMVVAEINTRTPLMDNPVNVAFEEDAQPVPQQEGTWFAEDEEEDTMQEQELNAVSEQDVKGGA